MYGVYIIAVVACSDAELAANLRHGTYHVSGPRATLFAGAGAVNCKSSMQIRVKQAIDSQGLIEKEVCCRTPLRDSSLSQRCAEQALMCLLCTWVVISACLAVAWQWVALRLFHHVRRPAQAGPPR